MLSRNIKNSVPTRNKFHHEYISVVAPIPIPEENPFLWLELGLTTHGKWKIPSVPSFLF